MIDGEYERLGIDVGYRPHLRVVASSLFLAVDEFGGAFVGSRTRHSVRGARQEEEDEKDEEGRGRGK